VEISLKVAKASVSYTGKIKGIDETNEDIIGAPEDILSFTTGHAKQCLTKNLVGRYALKVSFKLSMGEFGVDVSIAAAATS
jgi:hypothetical protein